MKANNIQRPRPIEILAVFLNGDIVMVLIKEKQYEGILNQDKLALYHETRIMGQ